ncbi:class I SAM-dependent methyltransferase [Solemya velum gill symbiont]|uniref:Methyltransferase type 11 domain-containing protein n=2 Tax=Solemya velum gill symbiont TaxID=2340 RepID=A0A0B0H9J4_SOVGS|nr:class I SAM-dependent methyltransferase [Solemya velum gill symbiont]KHF25312.1 hypothetical protein JV46_06450 [Solemya velum gill symbiont]OOY35147.1 hypothetical protein BOV88_06425 [Solemya velum gill symbiont]OOY37837.1 hypothetical protein BOV89_05285 [Solemya velum gill symbiont]OOY41132.1 hypothetical protein BOV90_00625 [Solemya velum gill symbiont]OOY44964.1 hypothetical protein BOV92_07325 [Solemya velum gill symbiont]
MRPVAEDVALFENAIKAASTGQSAGSLRGLILGVTPELYSLPWPAGSEVRAADRTAEMIEYVWPGSTSMVFQSDWREIDSPDASFNIILCDGGWHLLDYPQEQAQLAHQLARMLIPGGLFAVRLFVTPVVPEHPDEVLKELFSGTIPNLNQLKLRLGMAMQTSAEKGVALHDIWTQLNRLEADWSHLAERLGWPLEHLEAIEAYHDTSARYHFVTVEQVIEQLCRASGGSFQLEDMSTPAYPMGGQCPTLLFRRQADD